MRENVYYYKTILVTMLTFVFILMNLCMKPTNTNNKFKYHITRGFTPIKSHPLHSLISIVIVPMVNLFKKNHELDILAWAEKP